MNSVSETQRHAGAALAGMLALLPPRHRHGQRRTIIWPQFAMKFSSSKMITKPGSRAWKTDCKKPKPNRKRQMPQRLPRDCATAAETAEKAAELAAEPPPPAHRHRGERVQSRHRRGAERLRFSRVARPNDHQNRRFRTGRRGAGLAARGFSLGESEVLWANIDPLLAGFLDFSMPDNHSSRVEEAYIQTTVSERASR